MKKRCWISVRMTLVADTRVPPLSEVIKITQYFECDEGESTEVLVAAGYPPPVVHLNDEIYRAVLTEAVRSLTYQTMPAFIIDRDWTIRKANQPLIRLFSAEVAYPHPHLIEGSNVLDLLFDTASPVRRQLTLTRDKPDKNWENVAERNLYFFRQVNILSQYEQWFIDRIARIKDLDRALGPALWSRVAAPTYESSTEFRLTLLYARRQIGACLRITQVPRFEFPQMWSYIPDIDPLSQAVFDEIIR